MFINQNNILVTKSPHPVGAFNSYHFAGSGWVVKTTFMGDVEGVLGDAEEVLGGVEGILRSVWVSKG